MFLVIGAGLTVCSPAVANSVNAALGVSVTVIDRCLVHGDGRGASCAGEPSYAVGIDHARVAAVRDELTVVDEHAHKSGYGRALASSGMVDSDAADRGGSGADDTLRTIAAEAAPVDAVRVTYSF